MNSLYVFRIGPLDAEGDYIFVSIADEEALPIVDAKTDIEGLQAIVEQFPGWEYLCEPRLADAGANLGFVARDMPVYIQVMRATIAMRIHLDVELESILDIHVVDRFLHAAGHFWNGWSRLNWPAERTLDVQVEGSLTASFTGMVARDPRSAFVLFDEQDGLEEAIHAMRDRGEEILNTVSNFQVIFDEDAPQYVIETLEERYALDVVPRPLRTEDTRPVQMSEDELMIVSSALLGMAQVEEVARGAYGLVEANGKTVRGFVNHVSAGTRP